MPLVTFREVRPWAAAIREAVKLRKMPPWFADPNHGEFANDPRLTTDQIATIETWVKAGAPEGAKTHSKDARHSATERADLVITADKPMQIPANAVNENQ
jgi:hypothetical protein